MTQNKALADRRESIARRWLSIAALVLAGPVFIELLLAFFSSLRHPTGGRCVFNDNLFWATGGMGLIVYWAGPWVVLGAIVLAIVAQKQGQTLAISLRLLAAPGFGLLCALILSPVFLLVIVFAFQLFLSHYFMTATYMPLILPFIAFAMTYGPRWQSAFNDPKWFGAVAGVTIASYIATWALVRPFVLDSFSCSFGV